MLALISVYDKTDVAPFAAGLQELGWRILSSGNTARFLREEGVPATEVSDFTKSPEMFEGRVKTLHPIIHAGILCDRNKPEHLRQLAELGGEPIDLVVCNLYPFAENPSVEMMDIGGPAMVRAAAKNHEFTGVVVDPADYEEVLEQIKSESWNGQTRRELAKKAFEHTCGYDQQIAEWLAVGDASGEDSTDQTLPEKITLELKKSRNLRYGENPDQLGALYGFSKGGTVSGGAVSGGAVSENAASPAFWDMVEQLGGKELSYLNVWDAEAAWQLANSLDVPDKNSAAVIVKHANPCGAAIRESLVEAFRAAWECDDVSAFGSVIGLNQAVDAELAKSLSDLFVEAIIAPGYSPEALEMLSAKKNLRLLKAPSGAGSSDSSASPALSPALSEAMNLNFRFVSGGFLVQTLPTKPDYANWQVVSKREPTEAELRDLRFAFQVSAAVSSNAIVFAKDFQAVGIGAGQQNRRDAAKIAKEKAGGRAKGGACASDAFFPFADGLNEAAEAGCTAVVQPGGSIRDDDVVEAANQNNMAMVFTNQRRFRH